LSRKASVDAPQPHLEQLARLPAAFEAMFGRK